MWNPKTPCNSLRNSRWHWIHRWTLGTIIKHNLRKKQMVSKTLLKIFSTMTLSREWEDEP